MLWNASDAKGKKSAHTLFSVSEGEFNKIQLDSDLVSVYVESSGRVCFFFHSYTSRYVVSIIFTKLSGLFRFLLFSCSKRGYQTLLLSFCCCIPSMFIWYWTFCLCSVSVLTMLCRLCSPFLAQCLCVCISLVLFRIQRSTFRLFHGQYLFFVLSEALNVSFNSSFTAFLFGLSSDIVNKFNSSRMSLRECFRYIPKRWWMFSGTATKVEATVHQNHTRSGNILRSTNSRFVIPLNAFFSLSLSRHLHSYSFSDFRFCPYFHQYSHFHSNIFLPCLRFLFPDASISVPHIQPFFRVLFSRLFFRVFAASMLQFVGNIEKFQFDVHFISKLNAWHAKDALHSAPANTRMCGAQNSIRWIGYEYSKMNVELMAVGYAKDTMACVRYRLWYCFADSDEINMYEIRYEMTIFVGCVFLPHSRLFGFEWMNSVAGLNTHFFV